MSLYDDASLIMYPSGVKASKIYCQKPTDGSGDLTFSRASTATRVNSSGLIEAVASNVPRIDYTGGGCGNLLLEPQRTNLFLKSEPTSAEGASSGVTYSSYTWPARGFTNAVVFANNATGRYHYGGTVAATTQYTISCYIIMDDGLAPIVSTVTNAGDLCFVLNGTIVASTATIENCGSGVYRISATQTSGASNLSNNGVIKFNTQSARGFKITGLQIEAGSYPTSYIPTAGSTVTRVADVSRTLGITSLIGQTEGVLNVKFEKSRNPTSTMQFELFSSGNDRISLILSVSGNITVIVWRSGGVQVNANVILGAANGTYNVAVAYKLNDIAVYINGVSQYTNFSANVPNSMTSFATESVISGNGVFFDYVYYVALFKTRLPNATLATLTTI